MGLYSSFSTSQYYDDEPTTPVKAEVIPNPTEKLSDYNKPHQIAETIPETKKASLYAQAQEVASSKSQYIGPDFRDIYRVGQMIAVYGPNGGLRTKAGRIAEIVEKNLMYVWMEDTYRDVNNNYQVDFVTDTDKIVKL